MTVLRNGCTSICVNFSISKCLGDYCVVGESEWICTKLCAGCRNCALIAPDTFEIEEDFGRARAHCQSGCAPRTQEAIDTW